MKIEEQTSDRMELTFSVPQGSISRPTVFNMYASTLPETLEDNITLNGFADDHSIQNDFQPGTAQEDSAITSLENSLTNINEWMN